MTKTFLLLGVLTLAACTEDNRDATAGSDTPVQNPPTVTEPGPKTGTGGETQSNPPPGGTGGSSAEDSGNK
jgi:hypothetical protein